ncbi:MAG: hypothetical protein GF383_16080, partial [Candidatus Lokiarchaeota archaeon]|nr:hypothetical protein [Candidatus Lokiarchaeota archaeon]
MFSNKLDYINEIQTQISQKEKKMEVLTEIIRYEIMIASEKIAKEFKPFLNEVGSKIILESDNLEKILVTKNDLKPKKEKRYKKIETLKNKIETLEKEKKEIFSQKLNEILDNKFSKKEISLLIEETSN